MIKAAALLLALLLLLAPASAFKYLHRGPSPGAASRFTMLKGHTLSAAVPRARARGPRNRQLIDFNVELKRDAVIWDELEDDGATLQSCSRNAVTKKAVMTVRGNGVDPEDFEAGAAFVIGVDDWEPSCGAARPVAGIDPADDTLFFKIVSARAAADAVVVTMEAIPGADVAPVVEITVRDEPVASSVMPRKVMFGPQFLPSVHALARADNASLSVAARPTISHRATHTLFKGATLDVDARLSAGIRRFRVRRLLKTEVQWEQYLNARVVATLDVDVEFTRTAMGEIFRKPIPKFGFSARIPFVGRVRAGAFVMLDWVAELDVDVAFRSRVEVSYERREQVTARVIPARYNARNLLTGNSGSRGTSSLTFKDETRTDARVSGFAGVRPAVGVILSLGRKGVEGNIGAKVGLELTTQIKLPPFTPYTGSGLKLGKCAQCHVARAALSLKGKDLSGQLRKNGKVKKEAVLVKKLFTLPIGTLCAVPLKCGTKPATTTPPPTLPPPPPAKKPLCGACTSSAQCKSGLTCRLRRCQKVRRAGAVCSRCVYCAPGYSCRLNRLKRPCRGRHCHRLRAAVRRLFKFDKVSTCQRIGGRPRPRPRTIPRPRPLPRPLPRPRPGRLPRGGPGRLPRLLANRL